MGNRVPGGTMPVSSPGISPRSQTARATATEAPAPSTKSQTRTFRTMMVILTKGVRWVSFSSRYGNIANTAYRARSCYRWLVILLSRALSAAALGHDLLGNVDHERGDARQLSRVQGQDDVLHAGALVGL